MLVVVVFTPFAIVLAAFLPCVYPIPVLLVVMKVLTRLMLMLPVPVSPALGFSAAIGFVVIKILFVLVNLSRAAFLPVDIANFVD